MAAAGKKAATSAISAAATGINRVPGAAGSGPGLGAKLFFGSLVLGTAGLGTWQLNRYFWKVDMQEQRRQVLEKTPVQGLTAALESEPFRRVTLKGKFVDGPVVLVGPRSPPSGIPDQGLPERSGYYLLSKFVEDGTGREIIVNRGWVPKSLLRAGSNAGPSGAAEITGVLRAPESAPGFLPPHDFVNKTFFWFDLPALCSTMHIKEDELNHSKMVDSVVSIENGFAFPVTQQLHGYQEFYVTPFKHATYATTWYSLSLAGVFLTWRRLARR